MKFHVKRVMGNASPILEDFITLSKQIEAVHLLSSDPNDLSCLTPSHFLIGTTLTVLLDQDLNPLKKTN